MSYNFVEENVLAANVSFIVAVAENGVIGRDGALPWRLSSDMKLFRKLTMGKPVIMGRRTWQSLFKQPLDGRDNIVVTHDLSFEAAGAHVVHDVEAALELGREFARSRRVDEIMVIGGAQIYRSLWDDVHRLYWTKVHASIDGDASLPPLDMGVWKVVSSKPIVRGERDDYDATLCIYERIVPVSSLGSS